ncbi:hypothetical protein [Cyanothece sp. BG0011]|uniref:hypothetical protein n=1 Tax=Cyanothece sp. BG0011 TaxID=2082950 RepID=UPI0018E57CFB|nr:hypothetical protein [Cyanothece sp. BG0011]
MLFALLTQKNWAQARIRSITNHDTVTKTLPKYSFDDVDIAVIGKVSMNEDEWLGLQVGLGIIYRYCQKGLPAEAYDEEGNITLLYEPPSRSADIGDLIQFEDGRVYRVEHDGYKLLPHQPMLRLSESLIDRRLVANFRSIPNWHTHRVLEHQVLQRSDLVVEKCVDIAQHIYYRIR